MPEVKTSRRKVVDAALGQLLSGATGGTDWTRAGVPQYTQEGQRITDARSDAPTEGFDEQLTYWQNVLSNARTPQERDAAYEALAALKTAPIQGETSAGGTGGTGPYEGGSPVRIIEGGWDYLRERIRNKYPDIPGAFIDEMVNEWNRKAQDGSGSTEYGKPNADSRAADAVRNKWNATPEGERLNYEDLSGTGPGATGAGSDYNTQAEQRARINRALAMGDFDSSVMPVVNEYGDVIRGNNAARTESLAQLRAANTSRNTTLQSLDQDFQNATTGANNRANQNLSNYMGETDGLMTAREGAGWGADVAADAESLDAQRQALGQAQGIFGGSLDYTSAAAGARADASDVARQSEALEILRREVETGGENQQKVFDKQFALSDPTVTAAERAAFEQLQGAAETRDRAQREAVQDALARRGLRSGATEIAAQVADRTATSTARNQGLLGIQGMAVERAMQALTGAGTTASQLRAGNQAASSNYYTGASDTRRQGFNEEYARGTAADAAASDNQRTRVGGAQLSATQANAMRTAADALSMFNKSGSQTAAQWQDQVAMSEASRIGGLANQRFGNTQAVNDANYSRTTGAINRSSDLADSLYNNDVAQYGLEETGRTSAATGLGELLNTMQGATNWRAAQEDEEDEKLWAIGKNRTADQLATTELRKS